MLTDYLINKIRDAIADGTLTVGATPTDMSFGTGSTDATGTDTELETEIHRKIIEHTDDTINRSIVFYCTLDTTEANDTIREFAIHDAPSGGNMLIREMFPVPYTKDNAEEMRMIVAIDIETATE